MYYLDLNRGFFLTLSLCCVACSLFMFIVKNCKICGIPYMHFVEIDFGILQYRKSKPSHGKCSNIGDNRLRTNTKDRERQQKKHKRSKNDFSIYCTRFSPTSSNFAVKIYLNRMDTLFFLSSFSSIVFYKFFVR